MHYSSTQRRSGSRRDGSDFTEDIKLAVWQRAAPVPGYSAAVQRKDACGAWIQWAMYGDTTPNSAGWEIDHIIPVARGGSDALSNLQPLQWQNNRAKGDGPLVCAVAATP